MNVVFRGTIAQAVEAKLSFNGKVLGQPELSMLTRLGEGTFANKVGTVKRPAGTKGKPSTIWEFHDAASLSFAVPGGAVLHTNTVKVADAADPAPTVILSDKAERVEPIKDQAELDSLMADEAEDAGGLDYDDLDGVEQAEDGSFRLSNSFRPAAI